jgi:hypothetical protein
MRVTASAETPLPVMRPLIADDHRLVRVGLMAVCDDIELVRNYDCINAYSDNPCKELVKAVERGMNQSEGTYLFGVGLSSVSPYARVVPSIVNLRQGRPTYTDDEGCAPLPGRSLLQCKNPPMVHPHLGIAEIA